MSLEWRRWCRLCANSEENLLHVFDSKDLLLPEKILKYLSIVVNNEDNLPQSVCESCSQRLGSFDCYAEQCHRVQTMYEALVGQNDSKVGIIREEFLQEVSGATSASTEENEVEDIKKDIEMLAIDVDPFIPSDGSAPSSKKHGGIRRKRPAKSRSTCRPRRAKKATIFRTRNEQNKDHDGERRLSSRIQAIINTQKEHGNSSEFNVKHELEESHVISNEDEDNKPLKHSKKQARIASESSEVIEEPELIVPLPKKRGRPPKTLVGAAKRKAKVPRNVKPKDVEDEDESIIKQTPFTDLDTDEQDNTNDKTIEDENADIFEEKYDFNDDSDDEYDVDEGEDNEECDEQSKHGLRKFAKSMCTKLPSIFRWECHVCNQVCPNWNSLSIHCRRAHQEPAHVVCLCAKVLASRASIIKHRLKHTNGFKYKCDKCEKSFHRRALFDIHLLSHVPKEEQPFVCCKCARRFHCEALLRQHERVHLPKEERLINPCDMCGKKFSSKSAVSAHLKAVHFGERPFVCDQCGHSFTSKGILQEHLTIHSDDTPFKCSQCRKSFKTKYRLKIHADTHRETPYQCPVCPLQLNTRRTLRMHLVVHRDTKAYQCATCGKAFRRAKDLKNHHNLHTGRRPYTCTFCPRTFANGSNCRSHKRRMHPDELRVYEANLASAANGDVQLPLHNGEESLNINSSANLSTSTEKLEQLSSVHLNMNSNMSQHSTMLPLSKTTSSLNSEFGNRSIQDVNMFMNPLSMKVNLDSPPLSRSSLNPADLTPTTTPTAYQRSSDSQEMSHASISHLSSSETLNRNSSLTSHMISNSSTSLVQDTEGNHLRSSQPPSRNGHMSPDDSISCNIPLASSHSTINLNSRRNMNSVTSAESLIHSSGHLQSLTPLNLNISEIHTNRQHSLSIMDESELLSRRRVLENFQTSNASVPRHHIPSLNTNLHSLHRQHQQHHHSLSSINRDAERELMELNRSSTQREMLMTNSNVNVMHHSQHSTSNSEQVGVLHDFSTSLNHLYHQHQTPTMTSAVAAAIAHSSTVGVPAFPGNPYVHHNMNYSRGNGAM